MIPSYSDSNTIYFFIDSVNLNFPGFSKLLKGINEVFPHSQVISSLDGRSISDYIIPIGVVASNIYLKSAFQKRISFLVDSTVLSQWSGLKFYYRRKEFYNKQFLRLMLRLIKYLIIEWRIVNSYKKVIFVSPYDASFIQSIFRVNNTYVIMNGADLPGNEEIKTKAFGYTLGILSYWGAGAFHDIQWFVDDYMPELIKFFPKMKLITAGRDAPAELLAYFSQNGVVHMGAVENLNDFFSQIDIYITTVRQECGILNKVLDAFAHKKIVVGLAGNMLPFSNLKNGYFTYSNLHDLVDVIRTIEKNPSIAKAMTQRTYEYILIEHDWQKNYSKLKTLVDSYV